MRAHPQNMQHQRIVTQNGRAGPLDALLRRLTGTLALPTDILPVAAYDLAHNTPEPEIALCLQGCGGFHARKNGEPPIIL